MWPFSKRSTVQASAALVGYLVTTFNDQSNGVRQYISLGNNAFNFQSLNGGRAVLTSSIQTQGTRDPFLLVGLNRKTFWMLATDLDISKTSWQAAQTNGSRSIIVWSSSDMVSWSGAKALNIEGPEAGFVWAPSAVYENGKYYLFWSSRIYAKTDLTHAKPPLHTVIRYSSTKDFISFSPPEDYSTPNPMSAKIDQEFIQLDNGEFARFLKDESKNTIMQDVSQGGLFGTWTPVGAVIQQREGPLVFRDNLDPTKYHLWGDRFGGPQGYGYDSYESSNILRDGFQRSSEQITPSGIRHGSVTPLTADEFQRIKSKWNV